MSEKKHTTPAVTAQELLSRVDILERYVSQTIRERESARIKTLEAQILTLNDSIQILDEQLRNVKDTFFQVTGRRAQSLPIVEVE